MKTPEAPKAPNPQQTASAQTGSNISTALAQQLLNNTNQITPYGSLKYAQSGTSSFKDPTTGKMISIPQFTATTALTPNQQGLLGQEEAFDKKYNDLALQQTDAIGQHLSTPFKYDTGDYETFANDLYGKLNNDTNTTNQNALDTKLKNQGLSPGTPGYDDAMRNLMYSQDKGHNDFMLGAYNTGLNTALTERNQPINEISALIGGGQVQQPQFVNTPQAGVNGTDIAGLIQNNYNQQRATYNAGLGGIAGLGAAALGGWAQNGFSLSDRRAKKDIRKVGKLHDGTDIYSYKYKDKFGGGGLTQLGVMAQEVEKTHPHAVAERDDGYKAVNYSRLAEELVS
jgi:hypothetical protein